MNWIKVTQYLPGDNRKIQIWNETPYRDGGEPGGNIVGYYSKETGKWYGVDYGQRELTYVTHWAEMLSKPEDL